MEVVGVGQGYQGVPATSDDLYRRVDRGKELAEALEVFRVAPQVAGRLREAVTHVGLDVVLDYVSGWHRGAHGSHRRDHHLAWVAAADQVRARRLDQFLQSAPDHERVGAGATAYHQAAHSPGMVGRRVQRGGSADVGADQMHLIDAPLVQQPYQ